VSRKLDAAIAEALGYGVVNLKGNPYIANNSGYYGLDDLVPHYSTDSNAMLELEREMRGRGWRLELWYADAENVYVAHYEKPDGDYVVEGKAETEPLARALAACYALTGKEWAE